jgi:hypothetical protein
MIDNYFKDYYLDGPTYPRDGGASGEYSVAGNFTVLKSMAKMRCRMLWHADM